MRVLIVEDDAALGVFLKKGLELEGHDVQLAGDGQAGLDCALEHMPDLMVLDLSLPRKDGVQVLEELQGRAGGMSVLVLTGRNGVEDRVRCLNLGADDCLLKPFSFAELTARCRALLRRREQFADPRLAAGGVELNRMDRRVSCDGRAVELTTKEFALLEHLLLARGRTCSRAVLLKEVWQMAPDAGTNVVDVYVNYLRKKLGAARNQQAGIPAGPDRLIATVRGEGYAIAADASRQEARKPVASVSADAIPQVLLEGLQGALRGAGSGAFGFGRRANA